MEKYYTPELEEFHYGFEYECKFIEKNKGEVWLKSECGIDFCLGHIGDRDENQIYSISKKAIRVKYLDQEDIESLGFIHIVKNIYTTHIGGDGYLIYKYDNKIIISYGDIHESDNLFIGIIKNKSELKKLMKQLNIV